MKLKILLLLIVFFSLSVKAYAVDIIWAYTSNSPPEIYVPGAHQNCAIVEINTTDGVATCSLFNNLSVSGGYERTVTYSFTNTCNSTTKSSTIVQSNSAIARLLSPMPPRHLCCQPGYHEENGTCVVDDPCEAQKDAARAACNAESDDYMDWTNWVEETCSGAKCCPSGHKLMGGICIPLCAYVERDASVAPTPMFFDTANGMCVQPRCSPNEIIVDGKCKSNCVLPAVLDVTNGDCIVPVVQCKPCEVRTPDNQCLAPEVCPSGTYRNIDTCECTDVKPPECGLNMHWNGANCVADEVTRCPDVDGKPQIKDADGNCKPAPVPTEKPVDDPLKTPEENLLPAVGALKDDLGTMIGQNNESNKYLSSIDGNTQVIVKNQGVINENIKTGSQNIVNAIGDLEGAIDGLGDLGDLEGAIDGMATTDSMPGTPEFDATLPEGTDYSEYDDSDTLATDKATEDFNASGPITSSTPFEGAITATGGACINGVIMGEPVSACFDRPWMLQGYAIMKICMIALGYIQTAMLLNRAIVA